MPPSKRTLQDYRTTLPPGDVLAEAKRFFQTRNPLYSAFVDREGPGFVTFRGQGGEEIVIAATADDAGSRVTGSTYLFDMQLARFLALLPAAETRPDDAARSGAPASAGAPAASGAAGTST